MTPVGLRALLADAAEGAEEALEAMCRELAPLEATDRVAWSLAHLPGTHVLSSGFGAQAAVLLHLVTRIEPRLPVIFVDTQYLFPETYRFADELAQRLSLNLHVVRAPRSAAWIEARHGRLWEQGPEGLRHYNEITKVEPFRAALAALGAGTWVSGLRRSQSVTRRGVQVLQRLDGRFKLHPLFDWTDRDVGAYLQRHDLPYHPLWHRGYPSIGDWTTTRSLAEVADEAGTRFFGLQRECGLHGLPG
jgi:phosphoadenosine phosphosulfate reductase